jgi:hypothetical protein
MDGNGKPEGNPSSAKLFSHPAHPLGTAGLWLHTNSSSPKKMLEL